jgi:3-hydroxymyristoyl/3-hydroxydecanoyl-(acyl carrier protein) dehydratase
MPGVLIVEAMAQTGGVLLLGTVRERGREGGVLHVARQREVPPAREAGRPAPLRVRRAQIRGKVCKMHGVAKVDGEVVCEAEMAAMVRDR